MIKLTVKRLFAIALFFSLIFSLDECSLWYVYVNNAVDSFDLGYSERLGEAFFADYNWDGTEQGKNIVLPEKYNGATITGLGGYTGRGYPSPFKIMFSDETREKLCPKATQWSYANSTAYIKNCDVQYLTFQLHISKSIKKAQNLSMGGIILAEYEENGEKKYNVYVLTCYVTCDENNKVFYSNDGKLYFKEDDVLVEDIIYTDFDLDKYNEAHSDGPFINSVFR